MPQQNPKSHENKYGGSLRHHPEHDMHIYENFTDDNQDFLPSSVEYNDQEETKFNAEDRLAHDHHDRPEPHKSADDYEPSIYSDGGHGRHRTPVSTPTPPKENADNKDYAMNKDFAQGAKAKYEDTEEKTHHSWWPFGRK